MQNDTVPKFHPFIPHIKTDPPEIQPTKIKTCNIELSKIKDNTLIPKNNYRR